VGDCKMASFETRAFLAASHDQYLCPLSAVQMPAAALQALLAPVWAGAQSLIPIHRASETANDTPRHMANGFSYSVTLKSQNGTEWPEQRLVVQSLKHADAQRRALEQRLTKAEQDVQALNRRGRGRKRLSEEELRTAVEACCKRHGVADLLTVDYRVTTQTSLKRAYRGRPGRGVTTTTVTVLAQRNTLAYEETVRGLGWRVFVCNDPELGLGEAVLAYREEYLIERGFNRLRGKLLGMTPLYLSSCTRIKGLIRLLSIGLRVLCLTEFTVREALREKAEKLSGLYAGNPKRATAKPTTEMMLRTFVGIALIGATIGGMDVHSVTPLNPVQSRILDLLGFSPTLYQGLGARSEDVAFQMSEP